MYFLFASEMNVIFGISILTSESTKFMHETGVGPQVNIYRISRDRSSVVLLTMSSSTIPDKFHWYSDICPVCPLTWFELDLICPDLTSVAGDQEADRQVLQSSPRLHRERRLLLPVCGRHQTLCGQVRDVWRLNIVLMRRGCINFLVVS